MQFVSFDLETTGFIAGVDRIVEIGAVRFVNGQVESLFTTLIDPQMPIPEAATKVNGITNDMVYGKPKIESILEPFAEFCSNDLLVAHNANFDFQFLNSDIIRLETAAPRGVILDTCSMARRVLPGLPNYKLGTLVQHMKIESAKFHRAEGDATYCGQLFIKMIEKMSGGLFLPPIENLLALSGKAILKFPQITPKPKQLGLFELT
ncbi:MAG: DNA polymerase III subunit epsilon [Bdellovibrionales bacterium RBG_16_40_8]|nr:MAG: DNA polymerase III subunit epsilon [Bdellovibrionales bacterium RBG_16_40_8]